MRDIEVIFTDGESMDLSLYKVVKSNEDYILFVWANVFPYTSEYKQNIAIYKNKIKYITYNGGKNE